MTSGYRTSRAAFGETDHADGGLRFLTPPEASLGRHGGVLSPAHPSESLSCPIFGWRPGRPPNIESATWQKPMVIVTDGRGPVTRLSKTEAARLTTLEDRIEAGLQTFLEVGSALTEIRDNRLYRERYGTFDAYCRQRWQMGRRNAYQLIEAATIVANVRICAHSLHGASAEDLPLPANEAQARPLGKLLPGEQAEAWLRAVETAPGGKLTAAHVDSVVRGFEQRNRMQVHYLSESAEWYTPAHVLQAVTAVLGHIDLDPCSNCDQNPVVPAAKHYTKRDDGLGRAWRGRVYMNPPYGSAIADWTTKLRMEYEAKHVSAAIALVPARTDTRWFRELSDYPRCFIHGRLCFGNSSSAPFPSAAFYLGVHVDRFAAAFAHLGDTFVRIPAVP